MTVTVIIPNYNHAQYLKQRIESVLNQTYKDFEIIILDDFSSDSSSEIINYYTSLSPKIKSFYNTFNSGSPFTQWDSGVRKAKGEFIWIAESDDFADPSFLEQSTAILHDSENVGIVYCNSRVIDEKKQCEYLSSEWNVKLNKSKWSYNYVNEGKDELSEYLYLNCTIHNVSGVLFRKSKYMECGYADHEMKFCGDWFLYIRILLIADIAYISEPLNTLRLHANSTYYQYYRSKTFLKEVIRIHKFVSKHIKLSLFKKLLMWKSIMHITRMRIMYTFRIRGQRTI